MKRNTLPYLGALVIVIVCILIMVQTLSPHLATVSTQTPIPTTTSDDAATLAAFTAPKPSGGLLTPDGRYRIDTDGSRIGMWDAQSGEFLALLKHDPSPVNLDDLHFSPDSQVLVAVSQGQVKGFGSSLYAFNLTERQETVGVFVYDGGFISETLPMQIAKFSPDQKALAVFSCASTSSHGQCVTPSLTLFNTINGQQVIDNFADSWMDVFSLIFSADGSTVTGHGCLTYKYGMYTFCAVEGDITWDVATGQRTGQHLGS